MIKLFILLFASAIATAKSCNHKSSNGNLVWSDEFNYQGLPDSTKWNYDVGGDGWGNNELQYYTYKELTNARVENGMLIIEAVKQKKDNNNYTSARLVTKGKGDWKFGRIEVKAKLPEGRGTWAAVWMLASKTPLEWPDDGEIDIMEHVGFHPGYVHASIHCKKYNHIIHTQKTDTTIVPDFSKAFHVYALEWDEENMSIFVDENKYFTFKNEHSGYDAWPFSQPFHLILNIAVGGNWGGQEGVDENIWPQRMEIDYVRVYQQ